jgi:hypothetical protein
MPQKRDRVPRPQTPQQVAGFRPHVRPLLPREEADNAQAVGLDAGSTTGLVLAALVEQRRRQRKGVRS